MTTFHYKGYTASAEFDADEGLLTGTLANMDDCIVFRRKACQS